MKLKREQIIKALECCNEQEECVTCPHYNECKGLNSTIKDALSLIKELTEENKELRDFTKEQFKSAWTVRADTVRKMQERLKKEFGKIMVLRDIHDEEECNMDSDDVWEVLDQIAKEMVED